MPSPSPSRPRRPRATRLIALVTAASALLLAGCATAASTAPPATEASACAPAPTDHAVAESAVTADAPSGPATACVVDSDIHSPAPATPVLPVTMTDAQGTEVTIESADRILALDISGTLASTVFALGLGDRVVGRDVSTGFAEASALPVVTQNGHQLNAEALLALDPSVILTDTSIGPWDVVLQMREAGVPVVVLPSQRSMATIAPVITQVAEALGVPAEGAELAASAEAAVNASAARIETLATDASAERLRMMFLYVRGQANVYYVFGEESGADELIRALGGIDAAADAGITGMRPLTAEAIVTAAPDLVLLMSKGLESVGGVDGLLDAVPALAQTPAGEHRRFVDMADHEILSFGPDYSAVLDALGAAIYGPGTAAPSTDTAR